jgi:hypothetical protein
MSLDELSVLRLRVVADADPTALVRVLERFQNLNVVPRKVLGEVCITGVFHVEVDVTGIAEGTLERIAAKLAGTPCIHSASWHRP